MHRCAKKKRKDPLLSQYPTSFGHCYIIFIRNFRNHTNIKIEAIYIAWFIFAFYNELKLCICSLAFNVTFLRQSDLHKCWILSVSHKLLIFQNIKHFYKSRQTSSELWKYLYRNRLALVFKKKIITVITIMPLNVYL